MRKIAFSVFSPLAIAALAIAMSLSLPAYAADRADSADAPMDAPANADANTNAQQETAQQQTISPKSSHRYAGAQSIETRIKTLHDKLKITGDQEGPWNAVAQAMMQNEQNMHSLLDNRQKNGKSMTAVDDLESYEKIADAHAEGLKQLLPAFKTLYDTMSDEQKKNADLVFGRYEGQPHHS